MSTSQFFNCDVTKHQRVLKQNLLLKEQSSKNFDFDLRFLKKAANMRNFISQFHSKLCGFLANYGDVFRHEARRKGLATFVSCLENKVIPNGFLLKFNGLSRKSRKIVSNCSFNLMRDSLRRNNSKLQRYSMDINDSTNKLKVWCTSGEYSDICQYIH